MGSVVGGMAAQEAIKLITSQFVPLTGGMVYNAITSTTTLLLCMLIRVSIQVLAPYTRRRHYPEAQ
eukprot:1194431-Prorocentrum_minimum.AAC.5